MRLAFLYLILVNLLDFVTTAILVNQYGFWIEANPFLTTAMIQADSVYPILIHKIIPLFIFAVMMWIMKVRRPDRYNKPVWIWVVMTINLITTIVVIRSIYAINYYV